MTTGVLLVNLGTPDAPRPREVRRYLAEFLSDPRVLDMNPIGRWLLLHGVILRTRPRASAAAYAKVWTEAGSPLLVHSLALRDGVREALGDGYRVELGMRYGNPSIESGLDALVEAGVSRILAWPLFPQYAEAATGSAVARIEEILAKRRNPPPLRLLGDFYEAPGFIRAFADLARPALEAFRPDHVLLSYHGLPERQVRALDPTGSHCLASDDCCDAIGPANARCYRAHCFATTRALRAALDLSPERSSLSFQSRLGRTPWIRPFTDEVLPELAAQGVKRLAVLCPAFVADCLETLEEIGIRAREQWHELGGEELCLVPCPNAHPTWVAAVADTVRAAQGTAA
ncbi:MAG: ferrochelatase [Myxococcota bacterium]